MNWQEPNSLQILITDLNEIAADAYKHRIKPVSKKGGGGAYNSSRGGWTYALPKKFEKNVRARFSIQALAADFILVQASSPLDAVLTVSATVDDRGQLRNISYPGTSTSSDVPSRPPAISRNSTKTVTKVFEDL